MKTNYYTIFGVERSGTEMQIRKRFHELARQHHPDRFGAAERADAEAKFQTITEAFNTLSRPESRREHDHELTQAPASTSPVDDRLSHAYVQQGLAAYREGRWSAAMEAFEKAVESGPNDAQAWHHLGTACFRDPRRRRRALEAAREACRLEPMDATYCKLAATIFDREGLTAEARKSYRRAMSLGGPDPEVEQALAKLRKS